VPAGVIYSKILRLRVILAFSSMYLLDFNVIFGSSRYRSFDNQSICETKIQTLSLIDLSLIFLLFNVSISFMFINFSMIFHKHHFSRLLGNVLRKKLEQVLYILITNLYLLIFVTQIKIKINLNYYKLKYKFCFIYIYIYIYTRLSTVFY